MSKPLTAADWRDLGYSSWVASSLAAIDADIAEDGRTDFYTPDQVDQMSPTEVMDAVLTWNGIIGYAVEITEAVTSLNRRLPA